METFKIFVFTFIILVQMFHTHNGLVIRNLFSADADSLLKPSSIPVTVRQLSFSVGAAPGRGSSNIISASTPGGLSTFGEAGLNVLRRSTLLIADAIVNVLGGIATLIDMLQNYAQTGSIQFNNLSASSQGLTNRLVGLGTNAATTIMNTLSNEVSTSGNNGVGSATGRYPATSSQFIVSESAPITQTQVAGGRQSTLAWPQGSITSFPGSGVNSNSLGISGQGASVSSSQPQFGQRVGVSAFEGPLVSVTSTSSANGEGGAGNLNGAGISGFSGSTGNPGWAGSGSTFGWSGQGGMSPSNAGSTLGWSNSRVSGTPGSTIGQVGPGGMATWGGSNGGVGSGNAGWGVPGVTVGFRGPNGVSSWRGSGGNVGLSDTGSMTGWGGSSASGNTFGWGVPGVTFGFRNPSGVSGWRGSGGNVGLNDAGSVTGWGGSSTTGSGLGWGVPSATVGWGGPGGVIGWGGAGGSSGSGLVGGGNGLSISSDGFGGASGLSVGGIGGTSILGGVDGWDSSADINADSDGWDILNGITMYGASSSSNSTNAVSPLSTWMQTLFRPLETLVNATTEETQPSSGTVSTEDGINASTNSAPIS